MREIASRRKVPATDRAGVRNLLVSLACGGVLLGALPSRTSAGELERPLPSTWPQPYSVHRDKAAGRLTLSTAYYTVEHDLKQGGALARLNLTHGQASNLLVRPLETYLRDEQTNVFSDLNDHSPRLTLSRDGLTQIVTVEARLIDGNDRRAAGVTVKTRFEYHWGYIKVHKEFAVRGGAFRAREVCPVSLVLTPSLARYGYREGVTEQEGAPPFSFGSCRWGTLTPGQSAEAGLRTRYVPRYLMVAAPGVEGLEWFVGSNLYEWDLQLTGRRGDAQTVLQVSQDPAGLAMRVSPLHGAEPVSLRGSYAFDYYLGLPILEGHARRPWFHASFNRNKGDWVSADQVRRWAQSGIQTVHCHNDGDYYDDGLFWRDGSYPPYPDMEKYDQVIADCHAAGIRVATYFSNKELHPSTREYREHGSEWGRTDSKGNLRHNFFRGTNEFGAQMCLRSGWLRFLESSVDRVLTRHALDGVYYDWNVALLCCNERHAGKAEARAPAHWDIDELLQLMEWTRRRVGPHGLVIVHNTTTPMFATENFADDVVANEWGYGKWTGQGPALSELPLEWSLVGARARGVISYGQLDSSAPRRLHRLFALEALLSGVTPWPASPETFDLFPVLNPIGDLEKCRFADWLNQAVSLQGARCAAAVYSRPAESYLLLGNLQDTPQEVRCVLHPEQLPYPLNSPTRATLLTGANRELDAARLTRDGVTVSLPADSAVLVRVR